MKAPCDTRGDAPSPRFYLPLSWFNKSGPPSFDAVPEDILLEIVKFLPCLADALHFSLTSSSIFTQIAPALYHTVDLSSASQCIATLDMLRRRPDIARHVCKLIVRPDQGRATRLRNYFPGDGYSVSSAVRRCARNLDALQEFTWNGEDLPPYDDMWFALRISCPQMRMISTTMGSVMPSPRSHLFDFSNLTGFSLTLKSGFYENFDLWADLPPLQRLWDMLVHRCPNLERLSIDGLSARRTDARLLFSSTWKLRKLVVGPVLLQPQAADAGFDVGFSTKPPLTAFLERHSGLEALHLTNHSAGIIAADLSALDPGALPYLREFSGTLSQLQALPRSIACSLETIIFPEPMLLREITPLTVSGVLQNLAHLLSLSIHFVLQSGYYDNVSILRSIVSACPQLTNLDITCGSYPAFHLESFSRAIRPLSKLTTLTLRAIRVPGDEPMIDGAARLALCNPRLSKFTISYISRSAHRNRHHSPIPQPYETGVFRVNCDAHGIPISLDVSHKRTNSFGLLSLSASVISLGLLAKRRDRTGVRRKRYEYDLRPTGHPAVIKKSFVEMLLMGKGPAAEETRLMFFCCLLMAMALWGFMRLKAS